MRRITVFCDKKGAADWTLRKVVALILGIIILVLIIFGLITGKLVPLQENIAGRIDSVLIMFGLKDTGFVPVSNCIERDISKGDLVGLKLLEPFNFTDISFKECQGRECTFSGSWVDGNGQRLFDTFRYANGKLVYDDKYFADDPDSFRSQDAAANLYNYLFSDREYDTEGVDRLKSDDENYVDDYEKALFYSNLYTTSVAYLEALYGVDYFRIETLFNNEPELRLKEAPSDTYSFRIWNEPEGTDDSSITIIWSSGWWSYKKYTDGALWFNTEEYDSTSNSLPPISWFEDIESFSAAGLITSKDPIYYDSVLIDEDQKGIGGNLVPGDDFLDTEEGSFKEHVKRYILTTNVWAYIDAVRLKKMVDTDIAYKTLAEKVESRSSTVWRAGEGFEQQENIVKTIFISPNAEVFYVEKPSQSIIIIDGGEVHVPVFSFYVDGYAEDSRYNVLYGLRFYPSLYFKDQGRTKSGITRDLQLVVYDFETKKWSEVDDGGFYRIQDKKRLLSLSLDAAVKKFMERNCNRDS